MDEKRDRNDWYIWTLMLSIAIIREMAKQGAGIFRRPPCRN